MNPICRILRRRFCRTKWGVNSAVGAAEVVTSDFIGVCSAEGGGVCAFVCSFVCHAVGVFGGGADAALVRVGADGVGVFGGTTDGVGATAGVSCGLATDGSGIRVGRIIKLVLRVSAVCRGWTSDPQSPS
jgi:hypothetical protein